MKKIFLKSCNQGSALVWVLVICLIFGVLGAAIGWVALSMNNRSIKNNNFNQAYFTARSGVDAIYSQLNGYPKDSGENGSLYGYLNANLVNGKKSIEFKNIFSEVPAMKTCNVTGTISKGMAKLTAKAGNEVTYKDDKGNDKTKLEDSETVTLWAYRKIGNNGTNWPSKAWASDMPEKKNGKYYILGKNDSLKYPDIDVAVYQVKKGQDLKGTIQVAKDENTEKKAIFIYIEDGAKLTIEDLSYTNENAADKWFEHPEGYIFLPAMEANTERTSKNSDNWENWNCYYGPDVFIYIEGGGEIEFKKALSSPDTTNKPETAPYPFYVYAASAASNEGNTKAAIVKNSSGKDVEVYYINNENYIPKSIIYSKDGSSSEPSRLPLSGYKQMGKPSENGLMVDQWDIYKYERDGS